MSARFLARIERASIRDEAVLRLDPVRLSDEYDHIVVRFLRKELVIREVMVEDPGGNRLLFRFDGFRPDSGLADALFELAPTASRREP